MLGGVAGGLAQRLCLDATIVRIAWVLLGLVSGFGVVVYVAAWLLVPQAGAESSIGNRALTDRRGLALAAAFVPLVALTVLLGTVLRAGLLGTVTWTLFLSAAGLLLIWRNADPEEAAWLHRLARPVLDLGTGLGTRRTVSWRLAAGAVLLVAGLCVLVLGHPSTAVWGPVGGALLVVAAVVVVFGPWWLRLGRDLVAERQARARAEERAEMAARIHDSVLQTLALIQKSADQPHKVVQLARAQERELRAWLFAGGAPGALGQGVSTVAGGLRTVAEEVETAHEVPVEVVTVGDAPLDEASRALLEAAREAVVNAAKWSGAPVVSLYGEVEPDRVSVFVRDRGRGFDQDLVPADRRGIAESVRGRVLRHRGSVAIRSTPGEGTEVELHVPRSPARP